MRDLRKLLGQCHKGVLPACHAYRKAVAHERVLKDEYKYALALEKEFKKEKKAHPSLSRKTVMQIARDHLREEY